MNLPFVFLLLMLLILLLLSKTSCLELPAFQAKIVSSYNLFSGHEYNCDNSGIINANDTFAIAFCFVKKDNNSTSLYFRKISWGGMSGAANNILAFVAKEHIEQFSFIVDNELTNLYLIFPIGQKAHTVTFSNYMRSGDEHYESDVTDKIVHKFTMINGKTHNDFYHKKTIYICGMSNEKSVMCIHSFDKGLNYSEQNIEEYKLNVSIQLKKYTMSIDKERHFTRIVLFDEATHVYFVFKCVKNKMTAYTCTKEKVMRNIETEKEVVYISTYQKFITTAFKENNKCKLAFFFDLNVFSSNYAFDLDAGECSNTSTAYNRDKLIVTYKNKNTINCHIITGKMERATGCDYRNGIQQKVTQAFNNSRCELSLEMLDSPRGNQHEKSFTAIVPTGSILSKNCFAPEATQDGVIQNVHYTDDLFETKEDVTLINFNFFLPYFWQNNIQSLKCYIDAPDKTRYEIILNSSTLFDTYTCDIIKQNCYFYINNASKIVLTHNSNWKVDSRLHNNEVLQSNNNYVNLYDMFNYSEVNNFIAIKHNSVELFIPLYITRELKFKIPFHNVDDNTKIEVQFHVVKNIYLFKQILGSNFSDYYDISYEHFNDESVRRFYVMYFLETRYLGVICQSDSKASSTCQMTFYKENNEKLNNTDVLSNYPNFFSYKRSKQIKKSDGKAAYITENFVMIPASFGKFLTQSNILYFFFDCTCPNKNPTEPSNIQTFVVTNIQNNDIVYERCLRHEQTINNTLSETIVKRKKNASYQASTKFATLVLLICAIWVIVL